MSLSLQEAVARERIVERVAAAHHAQPAARHAGRIRRHVRAALLLRSLAERLDPAAEPAPVPPHHPVTAPHAGSPRPWTAAPRRTPHRHS
ncbi:hypothetical protein [Terrabacter sp. C0L_2]|uniref:hypothetical protein n=1 Tax=Terrabacter sp. C0L_2 TaxID=3108389 RepID=UPI002ED51A93|nr:hypothetical protein U5C87_01780 [Terrabacter sp. C0L_2]